MRPSRREFREMGLGERHRAQPVALGGGGGRRLPPRARRLPGRRNWNPAANGAGRVDGVAKVTGAKLYASDFRAADLPGWPAEYLARHAGPRAGRHARLSPAWILARLSGAMKPSVVVTAADLDRIGTRVPEFYAGDLFCPVGKTPLYLGQPVALLIFEKFDAFDQARLALRDGTFVKFGEETGPVVDAELRRLPLHPRGRPDAGRARCLFADPGRLGQSRDARRTRRCRSGRRSPRIPTAAYAKAATYGEQIRAELAANNPDAAGARPRVRDAIGRSDVPRAGMRPRLVRQQGRQARTRARRAVALRGGGVDRASCSARPARPSSRRGSTRSSPMSAAASAAATTRRSRSMWRWRRCSFPAARSGWRMTAISSSRAASSATPSRCASRIGVDRAQRQDHGFRRRPRSRWRRPRQFLGQRRDRRRHRARSASTTFRRSTSPRSRCIRAA